MAKSSDSKQSFFFNPTAIPLKRYKEIANTAIKHITETLLRENSKEFLKLIADGKPKNKILEQLEVYNKSQGLNSEIMGNLQISAVTLYDFINKDLQEICTAHQMNQAHLGYNYTNNVYDIIKSEVTQLIGAVDQELPES